MKQREKPKTELVEHNLAESMQKFEGRITYTEAQASEKKRAIMQREIPKVRTR